VVVFNRFADFIHTNSIGVVILVKQYKNWNPYQENDQQKTLYTHKFYIVGSIWKCFVFNKWKVNQIIYNIDMSQMHTVMKIQKALKSGGN
jgi:hypothetical protein